MAPRCFGVHAYQCRRSSTILKRETAWTTSSGIFRASRARAGTTASPDCQGSASGSFRMKLLLDESVPRRLGRDFHNHEVSTAQQMGWAGKSNSELLDLSASGIGGRMLPRRVESRAAAELQRR